MNGTYRTYRTCKFYKSHRSYESNKSYSGIFRMREEVNYEKSETLRTSERTETGDPPGRRGRAPSRRDGQLAFELGGREDRGSDTRTLLPEEAGGGGASRGAIGEGP